MRPTVIGMIAGLPLLLALVGCPPTESGALRCFSDDDCPPECECDNEEFELDGFCLPFEYSVFGQRCGGTCDAETACPEGTSCKFVPDSENQRVRLYACLPVSGTGGSGGAGGAGGTGGSGGGGPDCVCPGPKCVEFSDNTFDVDDWEHVAVRRDVGTSYSVDQGTDEQGNPDPYRFVSHTLVPQPPRFEQLFIEVAHGNRNAVYDPSDGAIRSLHYSYDGRALPDSRQASIRPLAKQDGKWFWTAFDSEKVLIDEGGWVTREWPAASLVGFGHAGELDLTENGTAITFGISTAASHTSNVETTRNTGVDNWRVVICKE